MVEINAPRAARQAEIDHTKTQLAAPALRAAKAEERPQLFRELLILRQENGRP
jgi:hypothetical protein